MQDLDSTLTYYGYRRARRGVHRNQYEHNSGASVDMGSNGSWSHSGGGSGKGAESLKEHLGSVHGSQHSEQDYQPNETPVYLGAPVLSPLVQFREEVVEQHEEDKTEGLQFSSEDHGEYPKSGYVHQKRDYQNHQDVYKHPDTGHEVRVGTSRQYVNIKNSRLRNPSKTKLHATVTLNGKEHGYWKAVGENYLKENETRAKMSKHLKKHFDIDHSRD